MYAEVDCDFQLRLKHRPGFAGFYIKVVHVLATSTSLTDVLTLPLWLTMRVSAKIVTICYVTGSEQLSKQRCLACQKTVLL